MAWNKRGNTSGGASTGRDGGSKRGGNSANRIEDADEGFGSCTVCGGTGEVGTPKAEKDEDGVYSHTQVTKCSTCGGSGRVRKKK